MHNVIIWGAGNNCKIVIDAIKKDKCRLIGIVDSNSELYHSYYMNKLIIDAPEVLIDESVDYIVISVQNCIDIVKQIERMGIDSRKVIRYWESDEEYDFIDANVKRICRLERGLERELESYRLKLDNIAYELGLKPTPIVKPAEELLELIIHEKKSLSRFGDGEFEIMQNRSRPWFQTADEKLGRCLQEVFECTDESIVIAIADNFGSLERYTEEAAEGIRAYLDNGVREMLMKTISMEREYYDAYVTRPYIIYRDKNYADGIFRLFKKIWEGRDILLVEGEHAYNGVRNNLFEGAGKIRRIIAPAVNAFSEYDRILTLVKKYADKNTLVLVSLGPTATVLAYDLAMEGIQALDIGQLDNEYDWYIRGAKERIEIPGKCVAEIASCHKPSEIEDEEYEKQIIGRVLAE